MYRIGVDMGGTGIKAGVVDGEYRIVSRVTVPTEPGFENVVRSMADAAGEAARQAGMRLEDFSSFGVGTPGSIDRRTGRLAFSNNTNWRNVPLREELGKYISLPIFIANDANCAIIGETIAGSARGRENVLLLTLGTGVGGGVVLNGKLFSGGDGMGAELGHTPLIAGGAHCTCGMDGCLESYASITALIRQTREAMAQHPDSAMNRWAAEHGKVSGRTAFDCARAGDAAAAAVVDAYTEYLSNGIGGLVNIFRPDVVLLGGGLSNEGENLLRPVREKLGKYVFAGDIIGVPPVERARLGNDAGIIGAACLNMV